MKYLAIACLASALGTLPSSQTITRVTPEVSSPGYRVVVEGTDLAATTGLEFQGVVGGFVGVWTSTVAVESASATRVTALVPDINGWIPPWLGIEAGSPFGSIRAVPDVAPASAPFPFYFLEGTGGLLENAGLGSALPGGDRPVISFDPGLALAPPALGVPWKSVGSGAPFPGNGAFVMELESGEPGSQPFLFVGRPGPGVPIGDAILAIDPTQILGILAGSAVGVSGDASVALPIPAIAEGFGPVVAQWVILGGTSGSLRLSNGLRMNY